MTNLSKFSFLALALISQPAFATEIDGGIFGAIATSKGSTSNLLPGSDTTSGFHNSLTFQDQWQIGGLSLLFSPVRFGRVAIWVGGTYSQSMGSRPFTFSGTRTYPGTFANFETEKISAEASYKSTWFGAGLSLSVGKKGELSLFAGPRANKLSLTGSRQFLPLSGSMEISSVSMDTQGNDFQVSLSGSTLQDHGSFKTFQRLTLSVATGGTYGKIDPSLDNWRMTSGYLERVRPTSEVRVTFGLRR